MSSTIIGKLRDDPVIKTTLAGNKFVSFTLIISEIKGNKHWETFIECSAWGTLAEGIGSSLHKGDRAIIFGNFRSELHPDGSTKDGKLIMYVEAAGPELRFQTADVMQNAKIHQSTDVENI